MGDHSADAAPRPAGPGDRQFSVAAAQPCDPGDPLFAVAGRLFVITGAAGALCSVMAKAVAERGARVALLDIDAAVAELQAQSICAAGGAAIALACDVLDHDSVAAAAAAVFDRWGAPHVLINGAGGNHPVGSTAVPTAANHAAPGVNAAAGAVPENASAGSATGPAVDAAAASRWAGTFFDLPLDGFSRVFDLNFTGTVIPSRVFGRLMAEAGGGSIINLSSMSALTPLTKVGAYSAAKAAVANFTRWLAVHLAPVGVRVNALAPGFLMTEQLRFLHIDPATGEYTERARQVLAHTPMGRYGRPEELVGAVIWLAGDASSFVTGTLIVIDGGFSSYSI